MQNKFKVGSVIIGNSTIVIKVLDYVGDDNIEYKVIKSYSGSSLEVGDVHLGDKKHIEECFIPYTKLHRALK